jgi:chromosome segregation ATPase
MDESKARPGFPGDRSQAAAEKLRALRERANQALEGHRSRLGEIEEQLTGRVRQLAEEFGATLGAATEAGLSREDELAALRRQVEEGNAKHERFVAQLRAAQQQLNALQSQPCTSCQQAAQQLAASDEELRRLREQLETSTREHDEDRARHEKFVEQLAAARQAITVLQHAAGETSNELRADLEDLKAAKSIVDDELAAARRDLAALHDECELSTSRVAELESALVAARDDSTASTAEALAAAEKELAENRAELVESRAELAQSQADLTQAQADLTQAQADLTQASDELTQTRAELTQSQAELAAVTAQVAALTDQVTTLSERAAAADRDYGATSDQVETLQAEAEHLRTEVQDLTSNFADATSLCEQLQQAVDAFAGERQEIEAAFASKHEALLEEKASLSELLTAAESELDQLRESLAADDQDKLQLTLNLQQAESACREYQRQVDKLEQNAAELAGQVAAGADAPQLRAELEASRAEAAGQLESARAAATEHAAAMEFLRADFTATQTELATLREASVPLAELTAARRETQAVQAKLTELQSALIDAQAETAAIRKASRTEVEYAELEQKCDLALADLQKLKRENGALRDDLAERPAASDQESPELIAVRSERDALMARITELEAAAETALTDSSDDQERADLQRRFEMAVDDVRQLKQENAKLKDRMAAAEKSGGGGAGAAPTGGNDWAAQRARLMASLQEEEGAGPVSSERAAERATVASTIAATDQALAAKDEELEELRAALEAKQTAAGASAAATAAEEALSVDDVVVAERQRLAQLTAEYEEKLRKAELELSLERAKLARDQAALRGRLSELPDAAAKPAEGEAEAADPSKPRRRWSFALGLQDDGASGSKKK